MICWAGLSAWETSAPRARSFRLNTKALTTGSATSASSNARRISRAVASMSASVSRPLPRSLVKIPERRSLVAHAVRLLRGLDAALRAGARGQRLLHLAVHHEAADDRERGHDQVEQRPDDRVDHPADHDHAGDQCHEKCQSLAHRVLPLGPKNLDLHHASARQPCPSAVTLSAPVGVGIASFRTSQPPKDVYRRYQASPDTATWSSGAPLRVTDLDGPGGRTTACPYGGSCDTPPGRYGAA